jgi:aminoglycoside 3-N-acetyltransferase
MTTGVSAADLVAALDRMGPVRGARLIVHSSLSSFGHFEGGARAVVGALLGAVGPEGLLAMPCFTYGRSPFDRATSPTLDGAVAEAFRLHPESVRSDHPTHSVSVWGVEADRIAETHEPEWPCGERSPLARIARSGGMVLLLGVTHTANSLLHVSQCLARVPYLDRFRDAPVLREGGEIDHVRVRRAGCSRGFDREERELAEAALVAEGRAGASRLQLFRGEPLMLAAAEILRRDPEALLCLHSDCPSCAEAREMIAGGAA